VTIAALTSFFFLSMSFCCILLIISAYIDPSYSHPHMHIYGHTFIKPYHARIHTYIHTYIHACIRAYIHNHSY
jgi:hypothetical protein